MEIADSSLSFDLTTKASLCARAGIVEYWVLDDAAHRLIVHRTPARGKYTAVTMHGGNESVAPLAAPMANFRPAQPFAD